MIEKATLNFLNSEKEKFGFWNGLTLIVLYLVAKKGTETRRLLGWAVVVRVILPPVVIFVLWVTISLL